MTHQSSKEAAREFAKDYAVLIGAEEGLPNLEMRLVTLLDSFARRARLEALEEAAHLVEQFTQFDHTTVPLVKPNVHAESRTEYLTARIAREVRALAQLETEKG